MILFVSIGTKLEPNDSYVTKRPFPLIAGPRLMKFDANPGVDFDARLVVIAHVSRRITFSLKANGSATRFTANVKNDTKRPSPLIAGFVENPLPSTPAVETEARTVNKQSKSRTKTSTKPFVSPGTKFVAGDSKATNLPSALMLGFKLVLFEPPILDAIEAIITWPV